MPEDATYPIGREPSEQEFRGAMGYFATGVTVVTTATASKELHGMTLNALSSVSLNPRLLLVCLGTRSRTTRAVLARGAFVVNVLEEHQQELSRRFSRHGEDHFSDVEHRLNDMGLPELPDTLGVFTCVVVNVHAAGDHYVVIGRVRSCRMGEGAPLLFFGGQYGRCERAA